MAGNQNNETPYAELRLELQCQLGAIEYEPYVENMLETIHVETVHPPGDTNNQHVFSVYDLDGVVTVTGVPPPVIQPPTVDATNISADTTTLTADIQ
jgi:hypothetical protein